MEKTARDYLATELDHFQKAYNIQFTHFMGVFYFWTLLVTMPVTAGLLVNKDNLKNDAFAILLMLIACIGWFLSAKMFDIRASQLLYISMMNQVRGVLYEGVSALLPKSYQHPFPANVNLQEIALRDFGLTMAIVMSFLDAVYFAFAYSLLVQHVSMPNYLAGVIFFVFGLGTYLWFVYRKVPEHKSEKMTLLPPPKSLKTKKT